MAVLERAASDGSVSTMAGDGSDRDGGDGGDQRGSVASLERLLSQSTNSDAKPGVAEDEEQPAAVPCIYPRPLAARQVSD